MDAVVTIDEQQRIVLFNAAAERMFGRTAGQMLGQTLDPLLPVRFRPTHPRQIDTFAGSGVLHRLMGSTGALRGLRADGTEFPMEATISQAVLDGRRILTAILRDVSERRRVEEALHASTTLLGSIVESSRDAIIGKSLDGVIISWNAGAEEMFGYTAAEAVGRSLLMLFPPERTAEEPQILARIARGERVEVLETQRVRKDGRRIDVSITTSPLRDSSGAIIGASKIARDITEQKRERERERVMRLNRTLSMLSGINSLIVRSHDRDDLLQSACRIAIEKGRFAGAWIGLLDPHSGRLRTAARAGVDINALADDEEALADDVERGIGLVARAIAERRPCFSNDLAADPQPLVTRRMRASLDHGFRALIALPLIVRHEAVGALQLLAREPGLIDESELRLLTEITGDVSFAIEHIEQEDKLHRLAYQDPLTGLGNRALLFDRLEQAIRNARLSGHRLALVFGDIKDFRQVNATWGRQAGDLILREMSTRLKKLSAEPENLARISADHYAGIMSMFGSAADLASFIERSISGPLSEPYRVGESEIRISTRVGIAVYPDDGADAETLFRNAETAQRGVKKTGQHFLFFRPEMNARVTQTLLLESKLRAAEERHEFLLHYQPVVSAQPEGGTVALEALLRWRDPEQGLIYPDQFVPTLEDTGQIVSVGQWVIRQAVAQQATWQAAGLRVPRIAVNVSAVQLQQPDFVERVLEILPVELRMIDFEITESIMMHSIEENIRKLQRLRESGVGIAIDDFGIGYSSLSYLTRLPVNTLKIDRAFVSKMTTDPPSMAVASAIISLARTLRLKVIGEGVETEEQARFLRLLGCEELQGYLFGKPAPPEEVAPLLGA